jgi:anti-sigma regulatory factor (Ser/Thr protein kinase)
MTACETKVPRLSQGSDLSDWPLRSHLALGPLPTAVPCARLHAHHILREWHLAAMADDTELIVSELVTNAVAASASADSPCPVGLWLLSDGRHVVILVADGNRQPPVRLDPDLVIEGGRGLMLVEALSTQWDFYFTPHGKVVWAICG